MCAACTNRDLVHCLHRTPCERWTESQVDLFHRNQNDYLTDSQSGDSSASSVLVYRPPPPPHHVLPSPGSPYTSTPGERPPRGYCQEGSTSPLQPTLSNLLQHRSHPGAAALTQATSVLSGNIVSTGAAADLDPPPAYNSHPPRPPVSSTGLAGRPPRPPPPSSTEEPPPPYSLATANVSDPPPPVSRSARPRSSTVLSSIPFPTWMQGSVSSAPSSTAAVSISQPFVMPPPLGDQSAPPGPSSVSQSVRPRTSLAAAVSTPPASDSQAPRTRTVRFQEPCPTVSNLDGTQGSQDMLLSESLERNLPVSMDLESLWIRIENFTGTRDDREHRYLDHCITEYLLALDGIDVQNHPELRESRRRAILKLYDLGNLLEQRCSLAPGAHQQPVTPPRGVSPLPISLQQAIMAPGNVDPLHVSQSSFRPSTIRPAHDRHSGGNSSSGSLAASLGLDASQAAQYERQSILNQQQAIIDQGLMAQQSALSQGHLAQNLLSAQPPISPPHAQLMWGTQDPRSLQSALTPTPEVDRSRVQSLCTRRDASLADQATPLLSSILGHSTTADPYAQAETPRLSLSGLGGSSGTVAGPRRRTDRASASAAAAFHRDLLHGAAHPGRPGGLVHEEEGGLRPG